MNCDICNNEIGVEFGGWTQGHNAQPVTNGRCCLKCNGEVVMPKRLERMGYKFQAP